MHRLELAGGPRRRDDQHLGPRVDQPARRLREPQVVAGQHPEGQAADLEDERRRVRRARAPAGPTRGARTRRTGAPCGTRRRARPAPSTTTAFTARGSSPPRQRRPGEHRHARRLRAGRAASSRTGRRAAPRAPPRHRAGRSRTRTRAAPAGPRLTRDASWNASSSTTSRLAPWSSLTSSCATVTRTDAGRRGRSGRPGLLSRANHRSRWWRARRRGRCRSRCRESVVGVGVGVGSGRCRSRCRSQTGCPAASGDPAESAAPTWRPRPSVGRRCPRAQRRGPADGRRAGPAQAAWSATGTGRPRDREREREQEAEEPRRDPRSCLGRELADGGVGDGSA